MKIDHICKIADPMERMERTYEFFDEDSRLNHSKAARVEFLTTVRYIGKYLHTGDKILDVGAGAGEYSLHFAEKGLAVSALELTQVNIQAFRQKIKSEHQIDLVQGNAIDLSRYPDDSFDVVLIMGPLYHLRTEEERQKCIAEAKRVCKRNGTIFFSFISNDMVILTELAKDTRYLSSDDYDHSTFKLNDYPFFVFHTVERCREMLRNGGLNIVHEVASDGASELLADQINAMDDADYVQYLRYHAYICEKPEYLGMSNHLLFVCKQQVI